MRKLLYPLALLGGLSIAAIVMAQPSSQHGLTRTAADLTEYAGRSCIFPAGGWTIVDCSDVAAASSAELNAWTRYVVQCTDDSYFATGTATAQDADSSDGYLPDGSWVEMLTTDTVRYYSCLNVNSDADCRHIECK